MQPNKTKNEKRAILWTIDDNPFATNAIHSFPYKQIEDSEILKYTHK